MAVGLPQLVPDAGHLADLDVRHVEARLEGVLHEEEAARVGAGAGAGAGSSPTRLPDVVDAPTISGRQAGTPAENVFVAADGDDATPIVCPIVFEEGVQESTDVVALAPSATLSEAADGFGDRNLIIAESAIAVEYILCKLSTHMGELLQRREEVLALQQGQCHQRDRKGRQGPLAAVIDAPGTCPRLQRHHQRPHARVCRDVAGNELRVRHGQRVVDADVATWHIGPLGLPAQDRYPRTQSGLWPIAREAVDDGTDVLQRALALDAACRARQLHAEVQVAVRHPEPCGRGAKGDQPGARQLRLEAPPELAHENIAALDELRAGAPRCHDVLNLFGESLRLLGLQLGPAPSARCGPGTAAAACWGPPPCGREGCRRTVREARCCGGSGRHPLRGGG
mmetsp:Transcript_24974/g.80682  ORF Transcript_24974/g.80682 Transcript_24974/m.80682 type:complete len:396 (+) Transcript_24974:155-1342(+)